MKMGDPRNFKSLNERQINALREIFLKPKSTRQITLTEKGKKSIKKIKSSVSDNISLFMKKKWANKELRRDYFETKRLGKFVRQAHEVPYYEANINYFLDFFQYKKTNMGDLKFSLLKESKAILNIFFELPATRILFLSKDLNFIQGNEFFHEAFIETIKEGLFLNWVQLNSEFFKKYQKYQKGEAYFISLFKETKKLIRKYLKLNKSDYAKINLRKEIIKSFNSEINQILKNDKEGSFRRLNFLQTYNQDEELDIINIKIKYLAFLLYDQKLFLNISSALFDKLTNYLFSIN